MSWFQKNRKLFLLVCFFVFAFLLFQSNIKDPSDQSWYDEPFLIISAPIQTVIVWVVDGVASLWKDYIWLVGIQEDNRRLTKEVQELQRQLADHRECQSENERLRNLVSMVDKAGDRRLVAARVIAFGTSAAAQTIRIDAGRNQGVSEGAAVISAAGLVGRVTVVVGGYSEVHLVIDGRSAVDVVVQRSRARGIVRGQGADDLCLLDRLVRTADVKEGDLVVTSGIGGYYPPGLLVGKVTSITSPRVGVFRLAKIQPVVKFDVLEEVLVIVEKTESIDEPNQSEKSQLTQEPEP